MIGTSAEAEEYRMSNCAALSVFESIIPEAAYFKSSLKNFLYEMQVSILNIVWYGENLPRRWSILVAVLLHRLLDCSLQKLKKKFFTQLSDRSVKFLDAVSFHSMDAIKHTFSLPYILIWCLQTCNYSPV